MRSGVALRPSPCRLTGTRRRNPVRRTRTFVVHPTHHRRERGRWVTKAGTDLEGRSRLETEETGGIAVERRSAPDTRVSTVRKHEPNPCAVIGLDPDRGGCRRGPADLVGPLGRVARSALRAASDALPRSELLTGLRGRLRRSRRAGPAVLLGPGCVGELEHVAVAASPRGADGAEAGRHRRHVELPTQRRVLVRLGSVRDAELPQPGPCVHPGLGHQHQDQQRPQLT